MFLECETIYWTTYGMVRDARAGEKAKISSLDEPDSGQRRST